MLGCLYKGCIGTCVLNVVKRMIINYLSNVCAVILDLTSKNCLFQDTWYFEKSIV